MYELHEAYPHLGVTGRMEDLDPVLREVGHTVPDQLFHLGMTGAP